jgi:putative transposase
MVLLNLENSNVKKKRHTEEQIIGILREAEVPGAEIRAVVRKHNITEQTFYRWRNKYGGMDVSDARKLKALEAENAKLKKLVAEQLLAIDALKEFSRGK